MSRPLQSSLHLATTVRLCVHALADREAFAPQDLPSLFVALDLVSGPGGWLSISGGSELPAVAQGLDVAAGIGDAAGLGSPPSIDLTRPPASSATEKDTGTGA